MFTRMFSREERSAKARTPAPKGAAALGPSAHVDTFARDNLPPAAQWPDLLLDRPEFQYPEHLNAAVELTDRMVENGFGDRTALIGNGRRRTYKELTDWSNRLAHALVEDFGVKPGNRVLVRSGNNPAMVAADALEVEAVALAKQLAAGQTFAHMMTKTMLNQEWSMTLDQAIEAEAQAQAICMQTRDFRRAYEAFVAKQKPEFAGD